MRENHIEVPIETLEHARQWMIQRPEIDVHAINVYGVSKGAEFALLGATKFDWIKRVVAVVPSDVVWAGYGESGGLSAQRSSWSFEGEPLPYVPLFSFEPRLEGMYRTNTERYTRSRMFHADRVAAARIPTESTSAKILLLAGDRDDVWDSSNMSRNIVERMFAANKLDQIHLHIFSRAGHQIAGTGTFPVRMYGVDSNDSNSKDIVPEGRAAARAWNLTIEFLQERSKPVKE